MALIETENNAYAKFWGDKQRVLWYVMVFSGVVNWTVSPKKLTKTYNKGFPNNSTLINYALGYLFFFPSLFIYLFFQSIS